MKLFETPEVKVVVFKVEDILTESGSCSDEIEGGLGWG